MPIPKPAILLALGAGVAGLALTQKNAGASPSNKGDRSSRGKATPSGADPGTLADQTTSALVSQDIARLRELSEDWVRAGDPLTAGALSFTLEAAVAGQDLQQFLGDGAKGSPLLRAFGQRVLLLEGRPEKLNLWADAWDKILPNLSKALEAKAKTIGTPDASKGTTDDAIPDSATLQKIIAVMQLGDPVEMRKLADELERLGFKEQADDLREAAILIEAGKAKLPDPIKPPAPIPVPVPKPEPGKPEPPPEPRPPAPSPAPAPAPKPAGGSGRVVIVKKGEGPFQIAKRIFGAAEAGTRFRELVKENIPPKKSDGKGGFTVLNPGERLRVPASWPVHPDLIADVSGPAPSPLPPAPVPVPVAGRFVVVKKGEGPFQIAKRVTGDGSRFRELVKENIPPKKSDGKGGFTVLNPGERLKAPASWTGPDIVSGEGGALNPLQAMAGRVALNLYYGKMGAPALAQWQAQNGIEPTGEYGPATAYCLCFKYGIVPTLPTSWGKNPAENRRKFASQMFAAARRDPARSDEFQHLAKQALGKA